MKKIDKLLNYILPLLSVLCIVVLWTVAALTVDNEYVLPTVGDTVNALFKLFGEGSFYTAFLLTFLRSLIAFILSFLIACALAVLSNKSRKIEKFILPLISVVRALPTVAIVLLLLFWTNNQVAPVVVTMLVVMPTTYTHVKSALDSVDNSSVEAGKVDGADRRQLFIKVQLPQIMPTIYSAVGSGISLNFKLMVAAEVLSATVRSLGNMLNISNYNGEIAKMLAIVVTTVLVGIIIEYVFNKLSAKAGDYK